MATPDLTNMLITQETRLRLALEEARHTYAHATIKGNEVEQAFRDFLSDHLPAYWSVGTGEAVDLSGKRTRQLDVVVSNEDQPFRSPIHDASLFFIEGMAAAGEVKSNLTREELRRAASVGTSLKALRNTHQNGDIVQSNPSDRERFYECPPFFVIAFESSMSGESIIQQLSELPPVSADGSEVVLNPIDAVFILGSGAAINYGDGQGALQFVTKRDNGEKFSLPGWVWEGQQQAVLVTFLTWLSATAPRVRRFVNIGTDYLMKGSSSKEIVAEFFMKREI